MRCVACGERAPTRDVIFYSNIGLVVMRLTWSHEGPTCSPCIHSTYWRYTLTTLAVGWIGIVSLVMTPFIIIGNTFVYCTMWFTSAVEEEPEEY